MEGVPGGDSLAPSRKEEGLGGGALFPGLRGSEILKPLPEVMGGLLPSFLWDHAGDHLKLEGFIEAGSRPVWIPLGPTDWVW